MLSICLRRAAGDVATIPALSAPCVSPALRMHVGHTAARPSLRAVSAPLLACSVSSTKAHLTWILDQDFLACSHTYVSTPDSDTSNRCICSPGSGLRSIDSAGTYQC